MRACVSSGLLPRLQESKHTSPPPTSPPPTSHPLTAVTCEAFACMRIMKLVVCMRCMHLVVQIAGARDRLSVRLQYIDMLDVKSRIVLMSLDSLHG